MFWNGCIEVVFWQPAELTDYVLTAGYKMYIKF